MSTDQPVTDSAQNESSSPPGPGAADDNELAASMAELMEAAEDVAIGTQEVS